MAEQNLRAFLTDTERDALEQQRTLDIARALQMQTHLLFLWGVDNDGVQVGVDSMRERLQDASDDDVKKVHKALLKAVRVLDELQPAASVIPLPMNEAVQSVAEVPQPKLPVVDNVSHTTLAVRATDVTDINKPAVSGTLPALSQIRVAENRAESEKLDRLPQATKKFNNRSRIVECPEGLPKEINYLFLNTLPFDDRSSIVGFSDQQNDALAGLVDKLYAKYASSKQSNRDKQIDRLRRLLSGVSGQELAEQDGLSPTTLYQSFRVSLPSILYPHKDELRREFELIKNMIDDTTEADSGGTSSIPVVSVREREQPELRPAVEPLVESMQRFYGTKDPMALQAIDDLFSVDRGVIRANEKTAEAARYLSARLRSKGVNLSVSITSPTARVVVENMLYGTKEGDETRWITLSETLARTPEGVRDTKRRAVEGAFKKLAEQIGGEKSVPVAARELQVANLRNELYKHIGVSQELTSQVIDRALEKDDRYSSDLGKALLLLNREAVGVGPDEAELKIIRWFTTPQPGGAPLDVAAIRKTLVQQQAAMARNGSARQYDNGYVTSKLLRLFDKIVTQRKDG